MRSFNIIFALVLLSCVSSPLSSILGCIDLMGCSYTRLLLHYSSALPRYDCQAIFLPLDFCCAYVHCIFVLFRATREIG
uniref:Secreted protein n=1 Tax=Anopheles darlingi TaxID=43151 RepID=A0A2M4D5U0_ANODA